MDKQYSWKRTEDIEIDLADLLQRLCKQWKRIVVCALISAVVLGGYGWLRSRSAADTDEMDIEKEDELTEAEEQAVADAVRLKNEIKGLEQYLDNSVLMQLDPYHKSRYVMLYCIDRSERKELPAITESYLNFVVNGGAADALRKTSSGRKMDKSCLAELISAYQKTYSSPYQVVVDDMADRSMTAESLFYVEVTGRNAKAAEKMANDLQDVLEAYSAKVKKNTGSHRLTLVGSEESVTADSGLQSQQHEKKALLSANLTNLKAMTDAFSKEQMETYREAACLENEDDEEEESAEATAGENTGVEVKYVFLGLAGGIFAYCCIFLCCYVYLDTVKSVEEMKRLYTFPVYGRIILERQDSKNSRAVSGQCQDAYERGKAQVLNRIRLVCKKQGMTRICAAADYSFDAEEKACLEDIARQLKAWGIEMMSAQNVTVDTAVWDTLTENGNVLMVCRLGTTTRRMVDDAMNFYVENGLAVTGAVVFSQNGKNRTGCESLKAAWSGKGL